MSWKETVKSDETDIASLNASLIRNDFQVYLQQMLAN